MSLYNVQLIVGIDLIVGVVLMFVFASIAAYYSFAVARVSVGSIYRERAILTGLGSLGLILLILIALTLGTPSRTTLPVQVVLFVDFIIFAAWIDSAVRTAVDQDFFHRDTLRWKFMRYPFLVAIGGISPFLTSNPLNISNFVLAAILFISSISFLAIGIAALFISGTRTRYKSTRRYLQWLGLAALFLVLEFVFLSPQYPYSLTGAFPLAISAYFLFRMSLSLFPTRNFDKKMKGSLINQ